MDRKNSLSFHNSEWKERKQEGKKTIWSQWNAIRIFFKYFILCDTFFLVVISNHFDNITNFSVITKMLHRNYNNNKNNKKQFLYVLYLGYIRERSFVITVRLTIQYVFI